MKIVETAPAKLHQKCKRIEIDRFFFFNNQWDFTPHYRDILMDIFLSLILSSFTSRHFLVKISIKYCQTGKIFSKSPENLQQVSGKRALVLPFLEAINVDNGGDQSRIIKPLVCQILILVRLLMDG